MKNKASKRGNAQLVFTIVSMALTLAMLVASGTAWLTTNRKANSNGVEMTVKSTSNLIIAAQTGVMNSNSYTTYEITFGSNSNKYVPATHDDDSATGLVYACNLEQEINPDTGLYDGELDTDDVPVYQSGDTDRYYQDYDVYIASAGGQLDGFDLLVYLSTPTELDDVADTYKALSIDFYEDSVTSANYIDTLNIVGLDVSVNNGETSKGEVFLIEDGLIPACTAGELHYVLRVYFDGALVKEDGNAFVRSGELATDKFAFGLEFFADQVGE